MKLGLIGDIHGDLRALDSALRHLETLRVDQILCTGDLIGYGYQSDAVVDRVRELAIPCARGNHDRWALERRQVIGARGWKPATLADATWEYLDGMPAALSWTSGGVVLEVHHGSPASDTEFITPYRPLPDSIVQFWDRTDASVLVLGHTHLPMIDRLDGQGTIINPGSLMGIPGVQTSYSFAVLEVPSLAVRVYEVRTGREIRRDPVFLDDGDG
ncbi:metallophosphoesterase family protein [Tautonia plasticadhaerens]|uniref:Phosphoesterase n=1 Tax=Tautonia plasticadhaerens TaxID=2527974 RepID=A0A518H0Y4_9BACT|nr:metallophosphoesterase family protein [Tautonia plasticadhaerens]QDV34482.1 phosphodiesterase [Tautonia plasticadhaerens]